MPVCFEAEMERVVDDSEFAGASGAFLEENRRSRLNLINEAITTMDLLKQAEEKAKDNGMESDKRGAGFPAG
jgi:hypothetical protein